MERRVLSVLERRVLSVIERSVLLVLLAVLRSVLWQLAVLQSVFRWRRSCRRRSCRRCSLSCLGWSHSFRRSWSCGFLFVLDLLPSVLEL